MLLNGGGGGSVKQSEINDYQCDTHAHSSRPQPHGKSRSFIASCLGVFLLGFPLGFMLERKVVNMNVGRGRITSSMRPGGLLPKVVAPTMLASSSSSSTSPHARRVRQHHQINALLRPDMASQNKPKLRGCGRGRIVAPNSERGVTLSDLRRIQPVRSVETDGSLTSSVASTGGADYGAEQITVLEGLEPVRKRPGMYIGSTGAKGLHHLVFEIVDNSVDEAMAGHCSHILVELLPESFVRVTDNGRGIPCDVHRTTGKSALETVVSVLHAGGKFGGEGSGYKVSGGLHGVGISVVNALSKDFKAEVWRDAIHHEIRFSRGGKTSALASTPVEEPLTTPLVLRSQEAKEEAATEKAEKGGGKKSAGKKGKKSDKGGGGGWGGAGGSIALGAIESGTSVTFQPDDDIFTDTTFYNFNTLAARMDELAYLNPGLSLELVDRRGGVGGEEKDEDAAEEGATEGKAAAKKKTKKKKTSAPQPEMEKSGVRSRVFEHQGGIREMVHDVCATKEAIHADLKELEFSGSKDGVGVDIALQWSSDQYSDTLISFANGIRTGDGGTHVDGLTRAVTRVVNAAAKKSGKRKADAANIAGEYIREGLTAVVSVKVPEPQFEGQTKNRLGNPEVRGVVDSVISEQLLDMLMQRPRALGLLVEKASSAQAAAQAARAARDLVRKKTRLANTVLPGKLADCTERHAQSREIFIVEGDSAAGSAKQGRDRRTQAILPLRGKILNVEKASAEQLYTNTELQALITALGLGVRGDEAFDVSQLRYGRIIIMTDADVDGAHIRMLLLTFLYRYHRDIVSQGRVFIACPPLYKIGDGGKAVYTWDEEGLEQAREEAMKGRRSSKPIEVQRFKGLGEMMPRQLWETTMDPKTRRLQKVTVRDLAEADQVFSLLMGDKVAPRKEFIMRNSKEISIQDLQL